MLGREMKPSESVFSFHLVNFFHFTYSHFERKSDTKNMLNMEDMYKMIMRKFVGSNFVNGLCTLVK